MASGVCGPIIKGLLAKLHLCVSGSGCRDRGHASRHLSRSLVSYSELHEATLTVNNIQDYSCNSPKSPTSCHQHLGCMGTSCLLPSFLFLLSFHSFLFLPSLYSFIHSCSSVFVVLLIHSLSDEVLLSLLLLC